MAEPTGPGRASSAISSQRIVEELISRISSGDLRCGEYLPKTEMIAQQTGTAKKTVVAACKELESKNQIYKHGKRWIIGPRPPEHDISTQDRSGSPVIVVLHDRGSSWTEIEDSYRTERFCHRFLHESERFGVKLIAAYADADRSPPAAAHVGRDQIRTFIGELGKRYAGALLVSRRHLLKDIDDWTAFLCGFGKPVVWFDSADENTMTRPSRRLFTRCHFNELAGIKVGLEALKSAGHCNLLYLNPEDSDWSIKRGGLLQQNARDLDMNVEISFLREGTIWPAGNGVLPHFTTVAKYIRQHRSATALIIPRDLWATAINFALQQQRVRIPQDMSILSFDNYPHARMQPIDTVDFGFGYIGYAAFHLLYRDIPIARNNAGDVAAQPYVVNKGSISRPRSCKLTF